MHSLMMAVVLQAICQIALHRHAEYPADSNNTYKYSPSQREDKGGSNLFHVFVIFYMSSPLVNMLLSHGNHTRDA